MNGANAILGFLLLSGCAAVGPDHQLAPVEVAGAFVNAGQRGLSSDAVDTRWWRGFNDKELDRLMDLAVRGNHDRRIAAARLREARALRRETAFDRFPTVTAGGVVCERAPERGGFPRRPPHGTGSGTL